MDQIKIGALLKELRKEHNLSQEELADRFGVSSRSISRWENGNTMPDISMMIELADFYDVDIRELISGERKSERMDKDLKETLVMVAGYSEEEKKKILNSLFFSGLALTVLSVFSFLLSFTPSDDVADAMQSLLLIPIVVFAIRTLVAAIQLRGKTDKKKLKKILWIVIPIATVIILGFICFMTFALPKLLVYGQLTVPAT